MAKARTTHDKTVWIMGAGASKSASGGTFPVLLEIPAKATSLGMPVAPRGRRDPFENLKAYVRKKFDVRLEDGPRFDLESVLTLLDIEIALDHAPTLLAARNELVRYLHDVFQRLTEPSLTEALNEYGRLAKSLRAADTVITFNWDVLLDEAFGKHLHFTKGITVGEAGDPRYRNFLNDFTGRGERTFGKIGPKLPVRKWGGSHAYYLKLHGSIDWVWCDRPGCQNVGMIFPVERYVTRPSCGHCFEKMNWLIIPPALNKRLFEIPAIRRLWNTAAREVSKATTLVVWGYSLPRTDFFSAWLIRQVEPKLLKTVVLINPAVVTGKSDPKLARAFLDGFSSLWDRETVKPAIKLYQSFTDYENDNQVQSSWPALLPRMASYFGSEIPS